ncbi:MAG: hypothetical protein AMXMBFR36_21050 [Acidobacteriota bacterium]
MVLGFRGELRKFITVFIGRDNSFYFHPYRPPGAPWFEPPSAAEPEGEGIRIQFPHFAASKFNLHKVSFHPSGVIHLTDTEGQKRKKGTQGPSFDTLELPYDCAVFIPCDPALLPRHTPRKGFKAQIDLPDDVRPFHVTFSIFDSASPIAASAGPYIPHPLNFVFPGQRLGLAVTMWPVQSPMVEEPVAWPPFPFFLLRIAA